MESRESIFLCMVEMMIVDCLAEVKSKCRRGIKCDHLKRCNVLGRISSVTFGLPHDDTYSHSNLRMRRESLPFKMHFTISHHIVQYEAGLLIDDSIPVELQKFTIVIKMFNRYQSVEEHY
jgi:hypothetical protein